MKKTILLFAIMILSVFFLTGCKKEEKANKVEEPKTVASKLSKVFETEIKKEKDIEKVAKKLSENEIVIPEVQIFSINKDDYLSGFKEEIKGYKKAVGISPMISTIPLIAYIFEVDDTNSFAKTLKDNADLRWNICTVADEMKITIVDNYVFFIMSPNSFETE